VPCLANWTPSRRSYIGLQRLGSLGTSIQFAGTCGHVSMPVEIGGRPIAHMLCVWTGVGCVTGGRLGWSTYSISGWSIDFEVRLESGQGSRQKTAHHYVE
jgi:hypothetical protein